MSRYFSKSLTLAGVACATAIAASSVATPSHAEDRTIRFEVGAGPKYAPLYEGSSTYKTSPGLMGGLAGVSFGRIQYQRGDTGGFSFGPSFRYMSERRAADSPILAGIPDRDWALEVGGKVAYEWQNVKVFGAVRKGLNGHTGIVGELGADIIMHPTAKTTVRFGPRMSMANSTYMTSYFSVPVTATALPAYSAGGGIKSTGLELSVRHQFNETWAVVGTFAQDRMRGDAARSPIVTSGSRDQSSISLLLVREFNLRF